MTTTEERDPLKFESDLVPMLLEAVRERRVEAGAPSRPRRARRRRWTIVPALAAGTLLLALVVPMILPGGSGGADPAAAAVLRRVALRAAKQPAPPPVEDGQFVYTKTKSQQTSVYVTGNGPSTNFVFRQPLTREAWIGTDGSGRIFETAGAVSFPTDQDRVAWAAAGSPDLGSGNVADETYEAGGLYYLDTSALPADPQALLDLIEEREIVGGPDGDWETFRIVGDLLRETSMPPAVRGALYEVAADLPGVELVGTVEDGAGRPGVAVAYTHDGVRDEMIFDPQTAELLGENSVQVEESDVDVESGGPGAIYPSGKVGTLFFTATYLASGVTDSTDDVP